MEGNNSQDLEIYFNYRDRTYKRNWQCIQGRFEIKSRAARVLTGSQVAQAVVMQKAVNISCCLFWVFLLGSQVFPANTKQNHHQVTKPVRVMINAREEPAQVPLTRGPVAAGRPQAASPGAHPHLPRACSVRKLRGSGGLALHIDTASECLLGLRAAFER